MTNFNNLKNKLLELLKNLLEELLKTILSSKKI